MKVLANFNHAGSYSKLHTFTSFPSTPAEGMLVFRNDGIVYVYSTVEGTPTWRPLNVRSKSFVHTQASAGTTWTITHNLHSQDIVYFLYDATGTRMEDAGIVFNSTDQLTLTFSSAESGKAVIFAVGDSYASSGGGGGGDYTLPTASAGTLGGVKVGSGLAIDGSGVLSTTGGGAGTGNVMAYQVRVINWGSLSTGAVPAGNLTWGAGTSGWTMSKVDATTALITHNLAKIPVAHNVQKGTGSDNRSYPTSTTRFIETQTGNNAVKVFGYMNDEDLYITLFFM